MEFPCFHQAAVLGEAGGISAVVAASSPVPHKLYITVAELADMTCHLNIILPLDAVFAEVQKSCSRDTKGEVWTSPGWQHLLCVLIALVQQLWRKIMVFPFCALLGQVVQLFQQ